MSHRTRSGPTTGCATGGPAVLLLGEERRGLSEAQRSLCDATVRIPMVGDVDSLNLAVAGSLMLYEVFRRSKTANA